MSYYDDDPIAQAAQLAAQQRGNLTAGMGGTPQTGLLTAPTDVPDYHNSVGDSQSGYVSGPSAGSKILSGLAGLSQVGSSPAAASPQAPAFNSAPTAPTAALTPAYTPLGAAPQIGGIAPVQSANLGMPSAAPSPGAPSAPAPLAARGNMTQAGTAPAASFDMASAPPADNSLADVSNAGVSSVPNFQPAPGIADHAQGLLGRIAQFAKKAGSNFATNVSGLTDAQMATMSPADIHRAKIAGFQGFANRLANPSVDAQGFRQNGFQALGSAIPAGGQAAQGYVQQVQAANQNATQVAQQHALIQGRARITQQYAPQPGDTQNDQLRKLDAAAQAYVGIGDDKGAAAAAAVAKSLREGTAAGGKPYSPLPLGDHYGRWNNATGQPEEYDPATQTWGPAKDLTKREVATVVQEKARTAAISQENTDTTRANHFQSAFVKPFSKPAAAIAGWEAARTQAAPSADYPQGNPAATKALVTAFVGAMEPNVQLRYATLQYLSNIDPSLAGQVKRMISTGQYGTLPPQQIAEMDAVVKQKAAAYKAQYQSTVKKGLSMYPDLAKQAPAWEDLTGQGAPAAAPSVDLSKFYTKP